MSARMLPLLLVLTAFIVCCVTAPKAVTMQSILSAASSMRNSQPQLDAAGDESSHQYTFGAAAAAFSAAAATASVACYVWRIQLG
eukprot:3506354-Pleurochrysis_carterae.AAC.4